MVVFLFVVAIVIVIIIVVRKNKRTKAMEDLKNSNAYALALEISEELEKKGYKFYSEPTIDYSGDAYGLICINSNPRGFIYFSVRKWPLEVYKNIVRMGNASGRGRLYGIENANIGVLVTSDEPSLDGMPEYIKIAAEIITNNGFGSCSQIE